MARNLFRPQPARTRKAATQPGWFADELHGLLAVHANYSADNLAGGQDDQAATMDILDATGNYLYTVTITRHPGA